MGRAAASVRQLSRPAHSPARALQRSTCRRRLRHDVWRRDGFGSARRRQRRVQGAGNGYRDAVAHESVYQHLKVSTSTSNFMIGVTAAASAGMFFQRGDIDPTIAAPVALGVLLGAMIGAKVLVRMPNAWVRKLFIPVIVLVAISMLAHGAAWL